MRLTRFAIALLLIVGLVSAACAQEIDVEKLIGKPDPAIQAQIQKVFDASLQSRSPRSNVDAITEAQQLKKLSDDGDELVRQLAIYVVSTQSEEDSHVLIAQAVLYFLDFPPKVPIRVLAPYLDADNRLLRDFARLWFGSHDQVDVTQLGLRPFEPANYGDYRRYVEWKADRKEDVPVGFIKYIYDRSPGRALLVFAYADSHGVATAQLQAIGESVAARRLGEEPTAEQREAWHKLKNTARAKLSERREIELAEHVVSNAIWLKQNKFDEQFQKARPEAADELAKLAKRDEWWARLYVAEIMRQHRELRQQDVVQQLKADDNELVSKCAANIK